VELIVAEREWESSPAAFCRGRGEGVCVGYTEVAPQEQVKQAGGKWNRSRKVWELHYKRVVALKLEALIVERASNTRYPG